MIFLRQKRKLSTKTRVIIRSACVPVGARTSLTLTLNPNLSRGRPPLLYNPAVVLVVFLRGINVGGYRRFRPSVLAKKLGRYDVVNVGAAGTFVVRKPGARAKFRADLLRKLPFAAEVVICDGRDLIRLESENPFATAPSRPDIVRFVSILSKPGRCSASIPCSLPPSGEWFARVIATRDRFVFGEYRRHMKTIGYLGQIDKLFGAMAITRNWNTIITLVRILKGLGAKPKQSSAGS